MAFRILSHAGKTTYGLKDYVVDKFDDIKTINTTDLATGSTAFVIETSEHYMLNSKKEWIKVNLGSSKNDPDNYDIIYDGGIVSETNKPTDESDENDIIYDGGGVEQ